MIYRIDTFDFKEKSFIKIIEQSATMDQTKKTIYLLS